MISASIAPPCSLGSETTAALWVSHIPDYCRNPQYNRKTVSTHLAYCITQQHQLGINIDVMRRLSHLSSITQRFILKTLRSTTLKLWMSIRYNDGSVAVHHGVAGTARANRKRPLRPPQSLDSILRWRYRLHVGVTDKISKKIWYCPLRSNRYSRVEVPTILSLSETDLSGRTARIWVFRRRGHYVLRFYFSGVPIYASFFEWASCRGWHARHISSVPWKISLFYALFAFIFCSAITFYKNGATARGKVTKCGSKSEGAYNPRGQIIFIRRRRRNPSLSNC